MVNKQKIQVCFYKYISFKFGYHVYITALINFVKINILKIYDLSLSILHFFLVINWKLVKQRVWRFHLYLYLFRCTLKENAGGIESTRVIFWIYHSLTIFSGNYFSLYLTMMVSDWYGCISLWWPNSFQVQPIFQTQSRHMWLERPWRSCDFIVMTNHTVFSFLYSVPPF